MKLVHPDLQEPIEFKENKVNILIIERRKLFTSILQELHEQIETGIGRYVFSEDGKELELSKNLELIIDPFSVDFTQKKITTVLLSEIKKLCEEEPYFSMGKQICEKAEAFWYELENDMTYPLELTASYDISDFLRSINFRVSTFETNLVGRLTEYMKIVGHLLNIRCFVCVNLHAFLDDREMEQFSKAIAYEKINVLLLENTFLQKKEGQEIRILDNDLCEIVY